MPLQGTRRERVRAATIDEIKHAARTQLAEHGAAALSLRAVARDLGMVSSALYRYFPSRDDLLTALIADAYADLADAVDAALAAHPPRAHRARALAGFTAMRTWALAHPAEFGLVHGAPVPGYDAPHQPTFAVAMRVPFALLGVVAAAHADGAAAAPSDPPPPPALRDQLTAWRDQLGTDIPVDLLAAAYAAWTSVHGFVALEVFGHMRASLTDPGQLFRWQLGRLARDLGLADR